LKRKILQFIGNYLLSMAYKAIEAEDFDTFKSIYEMAMIYDAYCTYILDIELE